MPSPIILISNDDGIDDPCLDLLIEAVSPLGELCAAAPATNQSSMGRSYPRTGDTGVIKPVAKTIDGRSITAYAVIGSPAIAVGHGVMEISPAKPDVCVVGINPGENIGSTMTGSGTVMAAIEASSFGIPAIAFSMTKTQTDTAAIKHHCRSITQSILQNGIPHGVSALSVNFPDNTKLDTSIEITRLSHQVYFEAAPITPGRDWSKSFYWGTEKKYDPDSLGKDSDIYCLLIKRHISITPISWDFTAQVPLDIVADHMAI